MSSRWLRGLAVVGLLITGCAVDPRREMLDQVNLQTQREVAFVGGIKWSLGDRGDCTTFALHNLEALRARGAPATAWIVWDNRGEGHAVVVSGDVVLDSHYHHIKTKAWLEKIGYRFRFPLSDSLVAQLVRTTNPGTRRG